MYAFSPVCAWWRDKNRSGSVTRPERLDCHTDLVSWNLNIEDRRNIISNIRFRAKVRASVTSLDILGDVLLKHTCALGLLLVTELIDVL